MRFRKNEYSDLDAAIEVAQRFWAGIFCNTRVYLIDAPCPLQTIKNLEAGQIHLETKRFPATCSLPILFALTACHSDSTLSNIGSEILRREDVDINVSTNDDGDLVISSDGAGAADTPGSFKNGK